MAVCTSPVRIEVEEGHLSKPMQGRGCGEVSVLADDGVWGFFEGREIETYFSPPCKSC